MFIYFSSIFFFFNHAAPTEIYTLSLHDALPISPRSCCPQSELLGSAARRRVHGAHRPAPPAADRGSGDARSEEHTSELQSRLHLVCRLLLEKKKAQLNAFDLVMLLTLSNTDQNT